MNKTTRSYTSFLETELGILEIRANDIAITSILFCDEPREQSTNELTENAKIQLSEYFAGARKSFTLPLNPIGTMFQQKVWKQLCSVKYGNTASYSDIAHLINKPTASRAVGMANSKNPISIVIPCHRIIGTNGKLTGYAGGLDRKARLLALESETTEFSLS